jgi:hypothetical protein
MIAGPLGTRGPAERLIGILEILENLIEHRFAIELRRQNSFYILHNENRRAPILNDAQVFPIQKVPMVILRNITFDSSIPGATHKGIGLTWWTTNEHPVRTVTHPLFE